MSNYLLRTEKINDSGGELLLFSEENGTFDSAEQNMNEYLKHLILLNHYSGTGPLIKAFWRWNEDDTLQELELKLTGETRELENLDQYYIVFVKDSDEEITGFTVRILPGGFRGIPGGFW